MGYCYDNICLHAECCFWFMSLASEQNMSPDYATDDNSVRDSTMHTPTVRKTLNESTFKVIAEVSCKHALNLKLASLFASYKKMLQEDAFLWENVMWNFEVAIKISVCRHPNIFGLIGKKVCNEKKRIYFDHNKQWHGSFFITDMSFSVWKSFLSPHFPLSRAVTSHTLSPTNILKTTQPFTLSSHILDATWPQKSNFSNTHTVLDINRRFDFGISPKFNTGSNEKWQQKNII